MTKDRATQALQYLNEKGCRFDDGDEKGADCFEGIAPSRENLKRRVFWYFKTLLLSQVICNRTYISLFTTNKGRAKVEAQVLYVIAKAFLTKLYASGGILPQDEAADT